jgi:5-methylcytosine-specific restriction protein A
MPTRAPRFSGRIRGPVKAAAPIRVYRPPTAPRASSTARGYGKAWRKAREGYLTKHPLCVACLAKTPPIARSATVVDHIVPHRGDYELFWDSYNNWQALCKPCHDAKTAREDGGFGNTRK